MVTHIFACVKIQQAVHLRTVCSTENKGVYVYSATICGALTVHPRGHSNEQRPQSLRIWECGELSAWTPCTAHTINLAAPYSGTGQRDTSEEEIYKRNNCNLVIIVIDNEL